MKFILYNAVPLVCVVAAVYLAAHDVTGWGWFLFAAFAVVPHNGEKS